MTIEVVAAMPTALEDIYSLTSVIIVEQSDMKLMNVMQRKQEMKKKKLLVKMSATKSKMKMMILPLTVSQKMKMMKNVQLMVIHSKCSPKIHDLLMQKNYGIFDVEFINKSCSEKLWNNESNEGWQKEGTNSTKQG